MHSSLARPPHFVNISFSALFVSYFLSVFVIAKQRVVAACVCVCNKFQVYFRFVTPARLSNLSVLMFFFLSLYFQTHAPLKENHFIALLLLMVWRFLVVVASFVLRHSAAGLTKVYNLLKSKAKYKIAFLYIL